MVDTLEEWRSRTEAFAAVAHKLLGRYETSKTSRLVSLTAAWRELDDLSLLQVGLFSDALRCIEHGLYRAAHVMAWAGFMDVLEHRMAQDGLVGLRRVRPGWARYKTIEELRENVVESQLIDAARDLGLLSKSAAKTLQGMLSKRNECAHPSGVAPDLNDSLGYVSELFKRIKTLQAKSREPDTAVG